MSVSTGEDGRLRGSLRIGDRDPIPARVTPGADHTFSGSFEARGKRRAFEGRLEGGALVLTVDEREYRLLGSRAPTPASAQDTGEPPVPASGTLAGTYSGPLNGTRATLTLEVNADEVRGEVVDATGYRYTIRCLRTRAGAQGELVDSHTGEALPIELSAGPGGLTLLVQGSKPAVVLFERGEATSAPGAERDPALLGTWLSETDGPRGESWRFRGDGTYLRGESQVSRAPGVEGHTAAGPIVTGRWRTEGDRLFLSSHGADRWTNHARFVVRDLELELHAEGKPARIWRRVR